MTARGGQALTDTENQEPAARELRENTPDLSVGNTSRIRMGECTSGAKNSIMTIAVLPY